MFELMNYWQGKLIFAAIALLVFSIIQSYGANKHINSVNEANSGDYRKQRLQTAPVFTLALALIILIICIVSPLRFLQGD